MKWMMEYPWPGNVRELQNVIAKCVVLASEDRIRAEDLPKKLRSSENEPEAFSLADNEKRLILRVMEACHGNKHEAARLLRISRSTLYSKLKRHDLWQG
jgi:two-component system response regulator HydG